MLHVDSPHPLRFDQPPGTFVPVHASAIGKALLAFAPDPAAEVAELGRARDVHRGHADVARRAARRPRARPAAAGWALNDGERFTAACARWRPRCSIAPVRRGPALAIQGPRPGSPTPASPSSPPLLLGAVGDDALTAHRARPRCRRTPRTSTPGSRRRASGRRTPAAGAEPDDRLEQGERQQQAEQPGRHGAGAEAEPGDRRRPSSPPSPMAWAKRFGGPGTSFGGPSRGATTRVASWPSGLSVGSGTALERGSRRRARRSATTSRSPARPRSARRRRRPRCGPPSR